MSADKMRTRILWVGSGDPWSPWTLSGVSRAICAELQRRDLLFGAICPGEITQRHLRGPGPLYDLERRAINKLRSFFPAPPEWRDESSGIVGRVLRSCPSDTRVIYALARPLIDSSLPIRRFRWMDLSLDDAARTGTFGHAGMSKGDIEAKRADEQRMLQVCDGVVALSTCAADAVSRDLGYPRDKITPIGAGPAIDTDLSGDCTEKRYAASHVLFVGRDWERKGGPLVLEAVRQLRETIPNATLTVVGLKSAPPCDDQFVKFVGVLDKGRPRDRQRLAEIFRTSSVFCMAPMSEPWGLVYGEAAQAGLPVVSFPEWALPDIVDDGVTGRLSSERDAVGLARALVSVLSDPARCVEMGRHAQDRVRDVLDWKHVVDRLLSRVLPEALDGRSPSLMQG